nr:hypothetical protein [Tanacetum cinerariifolium]
MLDIIAAQSNITLVIKVQRDFAECKPIIYQLTNLSPKNCALSEALPDTRHTKLTCIHCRYSSSLVLSTIGVSIGVVGIERSFLSQKDSRMGRGVKEKDQNRNKMITTLSTALSMEIDDTMNEDTMVVIAPDVKEIAITHVVDMTAEKEKQCILDDTTVLGSFPPLPTQVTTSTGNSPSKSSYANVTGKPREKKLNIRTLFTSRGNGIDVVVPVESIQAISDQFANTTYGFFVEKHIAYHVVATLRDDSRSSLSRPHPDAIARSLTSLLDRSRQRRFMIAMLSSRSI